MDLLLSLINGFRPFKSVKDKYFKSFVHKLAHTQFEVPYELPDESTFKDYMENLYRRTTDMVVLLNERSLKSRRYFECSRT